MAIARPLIVLESTRQPGGTCAVCGNHVPAGQGITANYEGRTLRFRCAGCYARFQTHPAHFLAGVQGGCCGGQHDHSPASEWSCE